MMTWRELKTTLDARGSRSTGPMPGERPRRGGDDVSRDLAWREAAVLVGWALLCWAVFVAGVDALSLDASGRKRACQMLRFLLAVLLLLSLFAAMLLIAIPASAEPRFGAFVSGGHLCEMVSGPVYAQTRAQWDARGVPLSYLVGFVSYDAMPGYDELEVLPGQTETRIEANLECAWREGAAVVLNWGRHPWVDAAGQPAYATGTLRTLYPPHEGYYRLYAWAAALARWTAKGDGRLVYLLPFPEHNGPWTPYYTADPALYRDVHGMIEWIMRHYAPAVRVAWAPWLMATHGDAWKAYAPASYHTLAPSLYAGGTCGGEPRLYSYDEGIAGPLAELRAFGRPIILAQTGVLADPATVQAWAEEFHRRVALEPGVAGVAWWDQSGSPECGHKVSDWRRVLRALDWRTDLERPAK